MDNTILITQGEDIMTDFQFKAIMAMVSEMLSKCKTIEDVNETKKAIDKLSGNLVKDEGGTDK